MSENVRIDQLAEAVMKGLTEYADLATDDMKKAVKSVGRTVQKEIEANAPAEEVGVKQLEKEIERSLHNG